MLNKSFSLVLPMYNEIDYLPIEDSVEKAEKSIKIEEVFRQRDGTAVYVLYSVS